jgi:hypothetical protein
MRVQKSATQHPPVGRSKRKEGQRATEFTQGHNHLHLLSPVHPPNARTEPSLLLTRTWVSRRLTGSSRGEAARVGHGAMRCQLRRHNSTAHAVCASCVLVPVAAERIGAVWCMLRRSTAARTAAVRPGTAAAEAAAVAVVTTACRATAARMDANMLFVRDAALLCSAAAARLPAAVTEQREARSRGLRHREARDRAAAAAAGPH